MVLPELSSKRNGSKRPTREVVVRALGVFMISNLLAACAPVQEKAPVVYRLPWLGPNGVYSFQDIELKTFRQPESLRGDVGEVVVDPRVTGMGVEASEPIGRWIREGSVMRPADFVTQQAATLYAHLEKLAEIDKANAVDGKMRGGSKVGLLVRISESVSSPMILNNAVYDGRLDALLIVPYSGDLIPISQNAGIIGHEHFHRVFQSIVLTSMRDLGRTGAAPIEIDREAPCMGAAADKIEPVPAADVKDSSGGMVPTKILNQTLLRGVNEGFADFWGWAYSNDEEFVARSLGEKEDEARRLDKPMTTLPQKVAFRNSLVTVDRFGSQVVKGEGGRVAAAYKIGTEYARVLRGVVETLVARSGMTRATAVEKVRGALAQSLPALTEDLKANFMREELEPDLMLKPFFTKLIRMSSQGPAVLDASSSVVVCEELTRLNASAQMMTGLCEVVEVRK